MLIRDPSILIGSLEGGQLNQALSTELSQVFRQLYEMSSEDQKKTHKGSVTLKLELSAENGAVTISADIKTATPKQPRLQVRRRQLLSRLPSTPISRD